MNHFTNSLHIILIKGVNPVVNTENNNNADDSIFSHIQLSNKHCPPISAAFEAGKI